MIADRVVVLAPAAADKMRRMWYGSRSSIVRTETAVRVMTNPARAHAFYEERLRWGGDDVSAAYRRRRNLRRQKRVSVCDCFTCTTGGDPLMTAFLRRWALLHPVFVAEARA